MDGSGSPRRHSRTRTVIKRVLHLVVKYTILTFRLVRRHPLPTMILAVPIIGLAFYVSDPNTALPFLGSRQEVAAADDRPVAAEAYMLALQDFNAAQLWESLSVELQASMSMRGESAATAQQKMEVLRQQGVRFLDIRYIGGTLLDDGRSVHLFLISRTDGQRTEQIPYTFTLNQQGKIVQID